MAQYTLINGYVGSKAPYAAKIQSLFDGSCTKYVEPFAGGAFYFSLYNGRYTREWLNDLNSNITVLYKALADGETRDETVKAILEIEKPDDKELAQRQFDEAKKQLLGKYYSINSLPKEQWIQPARNSFLTYSQSFNCAGKSYSASRSNEKYRWETEQNLKNAVERLAGIHLITRMDGVDVIKKIKGQAEVQLFCDPPYVGLYRRCAKLYEAKMPSLQEHIKLAQELADAKAAVVLCGYRAQDGIPTIYDAILGEGWHCLKLADTFKQCEVVGKGEAKHSAQEFVWTNRIPKRAALYLSMKEYKETMSMDEYWERIRDACLKKLVSEKHIREYRWTYFKLYDKGLYD